MKDIVMACPHGIGKDRVCDDCIADEELEAKRNEYFKESFAKIRAEVEETEKKRLQEMRAEAFRKGYTEGVEMGLGVGAGVCEDEAAFAAERESTNGAGADVANKCAKAIRNRMKQPSEDLALLNRLGKALQRLLVKTGAIQDVELTYSTLATIAEDYKPKQVASNDKEILAAFEEGKTFQKILDIDACLAEAQTNKHQIWSESADACAERIRGNTTTPGWVVFAEWKKALEFYANVKNYEDRGFRMPSPVAEDSGTKASMVLAGLSLTIRPSDPERRWETGFRNIVTAVFGPNKEFEISAVVESVKTLATRAKLFEKYRELLVLMTPYLEKFVESCEYKTTYSCVHTEAKNLVIQAKELLKE